MDVKNEESNRKLRVSTSHRAMNVMLAIIQEEEKEVLEAALQSMKSKLEISESNRIHAEVEAAKLRSTSDTFSKFFF